jgi:ClpP class serine protease
VEKQALQAADVYSYDEDDDERPFNDQAYMMDLVGDVAVIHVNGQLTNEASYWNRYYGVVAYDEIRNSLVEAINHEGANSILLDIDSPGGAVTGISEMSNFIKQVDSQHLPVYTATGGQMASGGYWLGSIGRKVYASELGLHPDAGERGHQGHRDPQGQVQGPGQPV